MEQGITLYQKLKAAGAEIEHYESDLYVKATPEIREIVEASGWFAMEFIGKQDGEVWLDIAFAFDPFWEEKSKNAT